MIAPPVNPPINWAKVITPEAVAYARGFKGRPDLMRRVCAISGCTPETCEWCRLYGTPTPQA